MKANFRHIILPLLLLVAMTTQAQIVAINSKVNADSVRRAFDNGPYFTLYKDNYFVFGPPIGQSISKNNTNVKFQISIAQRLTKSTLPFGTYLYLFYSQKCFWNVLEESLPMTDLNFNPGIGLAKPLFVKDRFIGKVMMLLEHESNGKSGIDSRSWNKFSVSANVMVDPNFIIHGKVWIPIIDGENNKDILDYCGIYQMGMSFMTSDRRFGASVLLVKRRGWELNYNTTLEFSYQLTKDSNQYIFLQYYNGYGEGLLEYNRFHSQLRVGIVIKPRLFSEF